MPPSPLAKPRHGDSNRRMDAMRINTKNRNAVRTHEGAPAVPALPPEKMLRRSVLSCLLWEDQFYEDGKSIADRIVENAEKVKPEVLAGIAVEAREVFNLRHAPLLLLEVLSRTGSGDGRVADTVARVVQRADELAELVALQHRLGARKMLPAQMRKGLARAFAKFDAYQLAKYDRDAAVKLRDVLRLVRPKPQDEAQSALWRGVKERSLAAPDTWEVALSGGADKKEAFERLLRGGKRGYLALLRNLRNMGEAGVDPELVREAIVARRGGAQRVVPFRYVAAARAAPRFEPFLVEDQRGDRRAAGVRARPSCWSTCPARWMGKCPGSPTCGGSMRRRRWVRSCRATCACSRSPTRWSRCRRGAAWPVWTPSCGRSRMAAPISVRPWRRSTCSATTG